MKMLNDEELILEFLDEITKELDLPLVRISKQKLLEELSVFAQQQGIKIDPEIILDDWEAPLRKRRLVKGHLIYYSIAREALMIEKMPSVEQMKYYSEVYKENIEHSLVKRIIELDPFEFEGLVEYIFRQLSWTKGVVRTSQTRDEGYDFCGFFVDRKSGLKLNLFGEVKHRKDPVHASEARDFLGMMGNNCRGGMCCGVYISSAGFTLDALKTFKNSGTQVIVYDIHQLVKLMVEERIIVKPYNIEGLFIDEQLWGELQF